MTHSHPDTVQTPVGMRRITVAVTIEQDFFVPVSEDYNEANLKEAVHAASHITLSLDDDENFQAIGSFDEQWEITEQSED